MSFRISAADGAVHEVGLSNEGSSSLSGICYPWINVEAHILQRGCRAEFLSLKPNIDANGPSLALMGTGSPQWSIIRESTPLLQELVCNSR